MGMKRIIGLVAGLVAGLAGPTAAMAAPAAPGAGRCVVAAQVFLEGLIPDQRKRVVLRFDNPARLKPAYPPGAGAAPPTGVRTAEMADGQRIRLHDFLTCALSSQGYQKALAVIRRSDMTAEALGKLPMAERETPAETGNGTYRITLFGEPSNDRPWAWRLEGHHLLLNFTIADGRIEASPAFLGADPAVVTKGVWAGGRVLDAEFARGLELLESLTPAQRKQAVAGAALPAGFATTPDVPPRTLAPQGIVAASLDEGQQRLLWRLIGEYVGNAEPGTAEAVMARVRAAGLERLYFSWRGPTERGQPVYYRVQSPALDIEFLHASASRAAGATPDLNHIHTWWRVTPSTTTP